MISEDKVKQCQCNKNVSFLNEDGVRRQGKAMRHHPFQRRFPKTGGKNKNEIGARTNRTPVHSIVLRYADVAAVACLVASSSPVPLKTRRVGQRCTLNMSRAETPSRWCGVVVRRGGASSGVVHVT
ncbi:uncharacterized protein TNCV_2670341 [Trichonephila clavipes]|nr:uncharacterized protein TNCV_2670341 [Trichonephila clavipes]